MRARALRGRLPRQVSAAIGAPPARAVTFQHAAVGGGPRGAVWRQICTSRTSVPAGARNVQAAPSPERTVRGSISVASETPYSGEQARGP